MPQINMLLKVISLLFLSVLVQYTFASTSKSTFSIIHFNDFHARYEPNTFTCNHCKPKKTYHNVGGFSKLYSSIKQLSHERPNPIILSAGDNFKGSLWYASLKWNVTQYFLNKLPLDAITLGNHEFDDGIDNLAEFLKRVKFPVVVSNLDHSKEPRMKNLYKKSVVIARDGKKIGIIGALLTATNVTSRSENMIFFDESSSVNEEADRLVREENVFTNIVLSHCGYEVDLTIAKKATSKISIIVGGHTDTFLYSGTLNPGPDKPSGSYPTVVLDKRGNKVLVVQASAYAKYLGNVSIDYDDFGNVINWSGNPIFLDENIVTDPVMDQDLRNWKSYLHQNTNKVLGETLFMLPDKICRSEECLFGNFVTDAMVFWYLDLAEKFSWTYASVALIHAGGIRNGLPKGNITFEALAISFPFEDNIYVGDIEGRRLLEIFERTFDDKHLKYPHLLQVSGLRLIVNVSNPEGHRVESLKIRCRECETPVYENVDLNKVYRVIVPGFLADFEIINPLVMKYLKNKKLGPIDIDVYEKYLKMRSPLYVEIEGRIVLTQ